MTILKVGTDCSGIEAPIMALQKLKIKHKHLFSSEIDENCRKVIRQNYHPSIIYDDITTRDHNKLPSLDIYVAGFPCQAFSGLRHDAQGFNDPRGTIFFECLETIRLTHPKFFILENVRGLLSHDDGNTFKTIMKSLKNLKKYNIYSKGLNTQDYGLPQNRPRVYIIGIDKKIIGTKNFKFPEPFPLKIKVSDIMDKSLKVTENLTPNMINVIKNRVSRKNGNMRDNYIVNANGSINGFGSAMKEVSPCLLANAFNFYSTKYKRVLTSREHLRLQGFPDSFIPLDDEKITKKQAGNSMSVNVLMLLLKSFYNLIPKNTHQPVSIQKLKSAPRKRIER